MASALSPARSEEAAPARPAVFLDRDGTLIEDPGYLGDPDGVVLIEGVPDALRRLASTGYALVVISNQAGVARGLFDEDAVRAVNARVEELLAEHGARIDAWHWCVHHPDVTGPCACRKPGTELLERAARELGLDLGASWMVGDHPTDVQAGIRAGGRGIMVLTGHGGHGTAPPGHPVVADLRAAADLILGAGR
ncbi:MAG TPA: HAD family hydrolase [Actinomycetota bacterium]|nr:HAD family hydrolase [Actinomycetota bacterium]